MQNKTRCPDSILAPILAHAAQAVGATLDGVSVKITQGHGAKMAGLAYRDTMAIKLTLPKCGPDSVDLAYRFWALCAHELGHIRDYQSLLRGENLEFSYYTNAHSQRAMRHDSRPQEVRAERYVAEARARIASGALQDAPILDLAIYFEGCR